MKNVPYRLLLATCYVIVLAAEGYELYWLTRAFLAQIATGFETASLVILLFPVLFLLVLANPEGCGVMSCGSGGCCSCSDPEDRRLLNYMLLGWFTFSNSLTALLLTIRRGVHNRAASPLCNGFSDIDPSCHKSEWAIVAACIAFISALLGLLLVRYQARVRDLAAEADPSNNTIELTHFPRRGARVQQPQPVAPMQRERRPARRPSHEYWGEWRTDSHSLSAGSAKFRVELASNGLPLGTASPVAPKSGREYGQGEHWHQISLVC